MNCRRIRSLLQQLAAGELPPETEKRALRHVEACPSCAMESKAWERLLCDLSLPRPMAEVHVGLDSLRFPERQAPSRLRWAAIPAVAVVLAAVVVWVIIASTSRLQPRPLVSRLPMDANGQRGLKHKETKSGHWTDSTPRLHEREPAPKNPTHSKPTAMYATAHHTVDSDHHEAPKDLHQRGPYAVSPPRPPTVASTEEPLIVILVRKQIEQMSIEVVATNIATGENCVVRESIDENGHEESILIQRGLQYIP